jgi:hypothetical protein
MRMPELLRAAAVISPVRVAEAIALVGDTDVVEMPVAPIRLSARGNALDAYGRVAVCAIVSLAGSCQFADNRCSLLGPLPQVAIQVVRPAASKSRLAAAAIVDGNYLVGPDDSRSVLLTARDVPYTVVGNITSGPIEVNGAALGNPWAPLNVI